MPADRVTWPNAVEGSVAATLTEPSLRMFPEQPIVVTTSIRTALGTGAPPPGGVVNPQPAAKSSALGMTGWIVMPVGAVSRSTGAPPLSTYKPTLTAEMLGDGLE